MKFWSWMDKRIISGTCSAILYCFPFLKQGYLKTTRQVILNRPQTQVCILCSKGQNKKVKCFKFSPTDLSIHLITICKKKSMLFYLVRDKYLRYKLTWYTNEIMVAFWALKDSWHKTEMLLSSLFNLSDNKLQIIFSLLFYPTWEKLPKHCAVRLTRHIWKV